MASSDLKARASDEVSRGVECLPPTMKSTASAAVQERTCITMSIALPPWREGRQEHLIPRGDDEAVGAGAAGGARPDPIAPGSLQAGPIPLGQRLHVDAPGLVPAGVRPLLGGVGGERTRLRARPSNLSLRGEIIGLRTSLESFPARPAPGPRTPPCSHPFKPGILPPVTRRRSPSRTEFPSNQDRQGRHSRGAAAAPQRS